MAKSILGRFITFMLLIATMCSCGTKTQKVDVLIVGGGASGIAAGIQSARLGASTIIVEETPWLGGMLTSAGVSAVDGNYRMPAGIFGEFRQRLADHYGHLDSLKTGWVSHVLFEPSVGNKIFNEMAAAESNLNIIQPATVSNIEKTADGWTAEVTCTESGKRIRIEAKQLIDATELGDVAKAVGVAYDLGMESRHDTGEDIAPEEAHPTIVQDLTYCAILKEYDHDMSLKEAPEGYNPSLYACCCLSEHFDPERAEAGRIWSKDSMMTYGKLPNSKYMINWPLMGNDYYVNVIEMTKEQRDSALQVAKNHTLGFVYFMQHELGLQNFGLADDEFPTADNLPFIPYHRESRRIHGLVRMDANHMTDPYGRPTPLYRTGIAVGDYPVDHHHKAYSGADSLPNLYFHPVPSYNVPMGVLIPQDVDNMIVAEKSISVSNIANGATRLQPVVVQLGQAAGALAALAALNDVTPADVSVRDVQKVILDGGGYLMPYLDVAVDDANFKAYQRIGSAGILRGLGQSIEWSNETWLRVDQPLLAEELTDFADFYGIELPVIPAGTTITVAQARQLVAQAAEAISAEAPVFDEEGGADTITRGQFAVMVDSKLNPFDSRKVDVEGNFID